MDGDVVAAREAEVFIVFDNDQSIRALHAFKGFFASRFSARKCCFFRVLGNCVRSNQVRTGPRLDLLHGVIQGTIVNHNGKVVGIVEPPDRLQTLERIAPAVPVKDANGYSGPRFMFRNH